MFTQSNNEEQRILTSLCLTRKLKSVFLDIWCRYPKATILKFLYAKVRKEMQIKLHTAWVSFDSWLTLASWLKQNKYHQHYPWTWNNQLERNQNTIKCVFSVPQQVKLWSVHRSVPYQKSYHVHFYCGMHKVQ